MLEFELTLNNVEYLQIAFHHAAPAFAKVGRSCRVLRPMFSDTPNVTERTKNGAVCATCRYMGQDGKVHQHAKTIHVSNEQDQMGLACELRRGVAMTVQQFYDGNHHRNEV